MVPFQRNFRDTLLSAGTTRTILVAAVIVAAMVVLLVVAYTVFDLDAVLPHRRP
jgi:hypothetical protein